MLSAQTQVTLACANGHGTPPGDDRFRHRCVTPLVAYPMNGAGQPMMAQGARPAYYPSLPAAKAYCNTCGNGARLTPELLVCPQCRGLRPLR